MKQYTGRVNQGILFALIQTMLYGAFLALDFTGANVDLSSKIKFSIIIICFCYVLFYKKSADKSILFYKKSADKNILFYKKSADKNILFNLQLALFFTVISDLFILLLDYYFYGVFTFIIVQQLYAMRLELISKGNNGKSKENKSIQDNSKEHNSKERNSKGHNSKGDIGKRKGMCLPHFLLRFVVQGVTAFFVCFILHQMGVLLDRLVVATVFYFICILTNVLNAIRVARVNPKEKSNVWFAVGMVFFLLCDINVGLFHISEFISLSKNLSEGIYSFSSILMWTFYAPSQVMIALSVKRK